MPKIYDVSDNKLSKQNVSHILDYVHNLLGHGFLNTMKLLLEKIGFKIYKIIDIVNVIKYCQICK